MMAGQFTPLVVVETRIVPLDRVYDQLARLARFNPQAAKRLEIDKRTVMGRARDSDLLTLEGGKRGSGYAWRLYLNGDNGSNG